MRYIPKNPTLAEIVDSYGGLQAYLDDPFIMSCNNGLGYRDIMLLLDVSVAAAVTKTGRNRRTIYKLKAIRDKESLDNGQHPTN